MVVLIMTWLMAGHPPVATMIDFESMTTCEAAKLALMDESRRALENWGAPQTQQIGGAVVTTMGGPPPALSIVCLVR